MPSHHARTLAFSAVVATGLLLAACSSSGPSAPANTAEGPTHRAASAVVPLPATTAAAGTQSGAAPAAAATSACALVTEQQLTPLLGADPGPGKATSDSSTASCAYTRGVAVTIVVDHNAGKSQFDQYCPNPAQPNTQNVTGVADGACLTIVGGTGPIAAMYVLKGPALMSINIQAGLGTKITPGALTALGKMAAVRL
jgi:hypothetical protein